MEVTARRTVRNDAHLRDNRVRKLAMLGYLRRIRDESKETDTGDKVLTLTPKDIAEVIRIIEIEEWSRANFL